jgi:hypothetical protein
MKAWLLDRPGGTLMLDDVPIPDARPGSAIVKISASALMSYLKSYVEGRLHIYSPPEGWFTPGGNAIGVVHEVGPEVYHPKLGQRVVVSSHVVADETVPEPAQFLLGITAAVRSLHLEAVLDDAGCEPKATIPHLYVQSIRVTNVETVGILLRLQSGGCQLGPQHVGVVTFDPEHEVGDDPGRTFRPEHYHALAESEQHALCTFLYEAKTEYLAVPVLRARQVRDRDRDVVDGFRFANRITLIGHSNSRLSRPRSSAVRDAFGQRSR